MVLGMRDIQRKKGEQKRKDLTKYEIPPLYFREPKGILQVLQKYIEQ
jgi:hypothetical protein